MLVRMLARRVLMALKARLSLGAWEGGVERGLGEAGSAQPSEGEGASLGGLGEADLRRQRLSFCGGCAPLACWALAPVLLVGGLPS